MLGTKFHERWSTITQQKPHLAFLVASPSGRSLLAGSEVDGIMVFFDSQDGQVRGSIDLKSQFSMLCALWQDESTIFVGGSNGTVYELRLGSKKSLQPISMHAVLGPLPQQVLALAFDRELELLAVAYGSLVSVYQWKSYGWTAISQVPEACHGPESLVHSLFFFGRDGRKLFVAYAEAGFRTWEYDNPTKTSFMSRKTNPKICRVGQASLSADESLLSISTLDQSIVTYPFTNAGPVLEQMREFHPFERTDFNPILPITHTSTDLILSGSVNGDVPVVKSGATQLAPIHQGRDHLIRQLAASGDMIYVGSTGPNDKVNVKCYSSKPVGQLDVWRLRYSIEHLFPSKPFTLELDDVLEGNYGTKNDGNQPSTAPGPRFGTKNKKAAKAGNTQVGYLEYLRLIAIVLCPLVLLILLTDPPGGVPFEESLGPVREKGIATSRWKRHHLVVWFGLRRFNQYAPYQFASWFSWMWLSMYGFVVSWIRVPYDSMDFVMQGVAKRIESLYGFK